MSKRHISRRQAWRIEKIQEERIKRAKRRDKFVDNIESDAQLGTEQEGLLVAHYGSRAEVEANDGQVYPCLLRQNLGSLVTGDKVVWRLGKEGNGVVVALLPRYSALSRPDTRGNLKPMAANIDYMIIVVALRPLNSLQSIDPFLVAAETLAITPVILFNKIDLATTENQNLLNSAIELYQSLDYIVITASCKTTHGLDGLNEFLKNKTAVFVGQSGVGKSSLIASLLPEANIRVGAISETTGHGVHTTSTARLYHLANGGNLIDSPGIREFALWHMQRQAILQGFKEFRAYQGACKFNDCSHSHEPGCAIQTAVIDGKVNPQRLASFHALCSKYLDR